MALAPIEPWFQHHWASLGLREDTEAAEMPKSTKEKNCGDFSKMEEQQPAEYLKHCVQVWENCCDFKGKAARTKYWFHSFSFYSTLYEVNL